MSQPTRNLSVPLLRPIFFLPSLLSPPLLIISSTSTPQNAAFYFLSKKVGSLCACPVLFSITQNPN